MFHELLSIELNVTEVALDQGGNRSHLLNPGVDQFPWFVNCAQTGSAVTKPTIDGQTNECQKLCLLQNPRIRSWFRCTFGARPQDICLLRGVLRFRSFPLRQQTVELVGESLLVLGLKCRWATCFQP